MTHKKTCISSTELSTLRHLSIDFLNATIPNNSHVLRSLSCRGVRITIFAQAFKLLLQDFQLLVG